MHISVNSITVATLSASMPSHMNLANLVGLSTALATANVDGKDVVDFIGALRESLPYHPGTGELVQLRLNAYPIARLLRNRENLGLTMKSIAHIALTISHDGPCDFDACDGTFYYAGGFLECDTNPRHRKPIR